MLKLCSFPSYDAERGKQLFHITDTSTSMMKVAGVTLPPAVTNFLSSYTPSGSNVDTYVTSAMGAGEHYGPNLNGDWFPQGMLERRHPTFVSHGNFFKFHENKKFNTKYGKIVHATYDTIMHKVVLVVEIFGEQLPDIKRRYDKGDPVFVSMGCAVPHDICSICGNKAKTPASYCDHISKQRLQIQPDGRMPYMINPDGTFFDISYVIIPADRTAFFLTKINSADAAKECLESEPKMADLNKIASLGLVDGQGYPIDSAYKSAELLLTGRTEAEVEKSASLSCVKHAVDKVAIEKAADDKVALMIKRLTGEIDKPLTEEARTIFENVGDLRRNEPELPESMLKVLARKPFGQTLLSLLASGIILKPREFQRLALRSGGANDACDLLDRNGVVFGPEDVRQGMDVDMGGKVDPDVAYLVSKYVPQKSFQRPHVDNRIIIIKTGEMGQPGIPYPFTAAALSAQQASGVAPNGWDPKSDPFIHYSDQMLRSGVMGGPPQNFFPRSTEPEGNQNRAATMIGGLAAAYLGYLLQTALKANKIMNPTMALAAENLSPILKILGGAAVASAGSEALLGNTAKTSSVEKTAILNDIPSIVASTIAASGLQAAMQAKDRAGVYGDGDPYQHGIIKEQLKAHPLINGVAMGMLMKRMPALKPFTEKHPALAALGWALPTYMLAS